MKYFIYDIETRARVSVVKRGLHVHAHDPATDLMVVCAMPVHMDGTMGDVLTWHTGLEWDDMEPFLEHIEAGGYVVAHNEAYDRTVWNSQRDKDGLP